MEFNKVTPEIIEKLRAIAPGRTFAGDEINEDYAHDEMRFYGQKLPDVVVEVVSAEEVSAIMKLANENKIPVIPRGAGTGLAGGAVAKWGGIMVSTVRMNHIKSYDLGNLTVTVEPGVLLNDLAADAEKQGLMYPPDPGEKFATLGGNVSTNAGGMRAVKYGSTRDYVRAMEVVLPTGEIVRFGSNVPKTSSGYNFVHLMCGSEGTLGMVTELTLKLIPQPKEFVSLIIPFEDLATCIAAVPQFFLNKLEPQALEFMGRDIVEMSEKYLEKENFPKVVDGVEAGAYLLVTFDGNSKEQLDAMCEEASEVVFECGALDVFVADTPDKRRDAWASSLNQFRLLQTNLTSATLLFPEIRLQSTLTGYLLFRISTTLLSEDSVMQATVTFIFTLVKKAICLLKSSLKNQTSLWMKCTRKLLKWAEKSQVSTVSATAR